MIMGVCVTVWVTREPDITVVRIVVAGDGIAELDVYAELEAGALLEVGSEDGV